MSPKLLKWKGVPRNVGGTTTYYDRDTIIVVFGRKIVDGDPSMRNYL